MRILSSGLFKGNPACDLFDLLALVTKLGIFEEPSLSSEAWRNSPLASWELKLSSKILCFLSNPYFEELGNRGWPSFRLPILCKSLLEAVSSGIDLSALDTELVVCINGVIVSDSETSLLLQGSSWACVSVGRRAWISPLFSLSSFEKGLCNCFWSNCSSVSTSSNAFGDVEWWPFDEWLLDRDHLIFLFIRASAGLLLAVSTEGKSVFSKLDGSIYVFDAWPTGGRGWFFDRRL